MTTSPTKAWPLRRLLLAAYVGLLGAALLVVSFGIRVLVERFLEQAHQNSAHQACAESWARLRLPSTTIAGPPHGGLLVAREPSLAELEMLVKDLARPERFVRWRDGRAAIALEAGGRPERSLRPAPPPPNLQWWVLTIRTAAGPVGTLELGTDRHADQELLDALTRYLMFCSTIVLLLAVLVCSRLSAYWLAPLQTLAQTLEQLAEGDLSARPSEEEGAMVPSEWRRLRLSANNMAQRLEASFVAQRRFISDASHELRTPLTAVSAMAEMLEAGGLNAEGQSKAQSTIMRESQRMSRLVEDLLALSRADEGRPLPLESHPLAPILESLVEEFSAVSPTRTLRVKCPRDAQVQAPATLVRTVVRNLLENAFRYSDSEVTCRVEQTAEMVEIVVEDQGCGIPEEELEKVFERFYRSDHSRTRATGGSGLGLAIVKTLVDRTGGEVMLSSKLGQGTTVRVVWKKKGGEA